MQFDPEVGIYSKEIIKWTKMYIQGYLLHHRI